jgi:hypothetical protein
MLGNRQLYGKKKPTPAVDDVDEVVRARMQREQGGTDPMTGAKPPPRGGGANSMTGAGVRTPQQKPAAASQTANVGLIDNVGVTAGVTSPLIDAVGSTPGDDDVEGVVQSAMEREMQAKRDELAKEKAKALEAGSRVAGLGGFGISGATAALQSDIAGEQNRDAIMALQQLEREQADASFQDVQRDAFIDEYEVNVGRDIDGDGDVGGDPGEGLDSTGGRRSGVARGEVDAASIGDDGSISGGNAYDSGVAAVMEYGQRQGGRGKIDYSSLPVRAAGANDVDMGVLNGVNVWYDPDSDSLFTVP